nr:retrotransposon Gag domain, retroviral aspartyl protease [Tanacetum cinerariifolium]
MEEPPVTQFFNPDSDQEETAEISLHAILAKPHPTTMKVRGNLHSTEVLILIDGGSTHNFISDVLVNELKLTSKPVAPFGVQIEEATWETYDLVAEQFPEFRLEDKEFYREGIIIEQRVKVNRKTRILDYEEYCSDILYVVSINEDTVYLCLKLHSASMKRRPAKPSMPSNSKVKAYRSSALKAKASGSSSSKAKASGNISYVWNDVIDQFSEMPCKRRTHELVNTLYSLNFLYRSVWICAILVPTAALVAKPRQLYYSSIILMVDYKLHYNLTPSIWTKIGAHKEELLPTTYSLQYNDEMRSLEHLNVRLRVLEKRKETKECLQAAGNTKAKRRGAYVRNEGKKEFRFEEDFKDEKYEGDDA